MFNKLLFIFFSFFPLLSYGSDCDSVKAPQVGRYQMTAMFGNAGVGQLYLLDTATGQVWYSGHKNSWTVQDAWIPQIAPLEE